MDLTGPPDANRALDGIPGPLWDQVSLARARLLMLDHDGTLAPFETDRARAVAPRSTRELLQRIAESGRTRLVVVSGRPVRDLAALLEPVRLTFVGEHGWEVSAPGERVVRHPLPRGVASRLERAARLARAAGLTAHLERKRSSIAVHTRGLDAEGAAHVTSGAALAWSPLLDRAPLRLVPFDGGLELRARGRDKGTAARELLAREPAGTLAVHVGDDTTDEDVFEALGETGFGVRVGGPGAPTRARAWLRNPDQVARFLETWLELTTRERRHGA